MMKKYAVIVLVILAVSMVAGVASAGVSGNPGLFTKQAKRK